MTYTTPSTTTGFPVINATTVGTRYILYSCANAVQTNHAMGIGNNTMWFSIPSNTAPQQFQWYAGATNIATLGGTGNLTIVGTITGNSSLTIAGTSTLATTTITNLTVTGTLSLASIVTTSTTDATSTTTGSITTAGGAGIAKSMWVGTSVTIGTTLNVTGSSTFAAISTTGLTATGTSSIYALTTSSTTDATSSITGSVIISGGVGIAKSLWIGTLLSVSGTSTLSTTTITNLTVTGTFLLTSFSATSSTDSTSTTTGAITTSGGIGIAKGLNVGTLITVGSTTVSPTLISWSAISNSSPTFTTSSNGTRILLYPQVGSTSTDYAIGMGVYQMWLGVPQNTTAYTFQFYGGTTSVVQIDGTGNIFTAGYVRTYTNNVGLPIINGVSSGTRYMLWQNTNTSGYTNYAIGLNTNVFWFSVQSNTSDQTFQWYGGATSVAQLDGTGNFTAVGSTTSTMFVSPNITNNPPSFNTTSSGTKLLMFNQTTSTSTNYAIGATAGQVWFSVPTNTTSYGFQFYGGTTSVATIDGTGNLFTSGYLFPTSTALNTPTFNTISSGTRLILWNVPTSSSANMAIGVASNIVWFGLPNNVSTQYFNFYGGTTLVSTIDGVGNFTTSGAGVFGYPVTVGGGIVVSTQMITFPNVTNAWPSFNTTSIGTRILLFNQTSSTNTNYAIGMSAGTVWFSVPAAYNSNYFWQFVGGTTSLCTIDAYGNVSASGVFTSNNYFSCTSGNLNTPTFNTVSSGTRYILWNSLSSTTTNYAIGMAGNTGWFSLPAYNGGQCWAFFGGTTITATIDGLGNFRGASWGTYSDIRLKENIVNARGYLSDLNKLRVVKFDMKADEGNRHLGLIAQEVEEVFPGLIETSERTYHGVENTKLIKYSVLNVMMLKAIQELSTQNQDLFTKNQELSRQLAEEREVRRNDNSGILERLERLESDRNGTERNGTEREQEMK